MPLPSESQVPIASESRELPCTTRLLPWLPGALMLVVYGLTLNHWITRESLIQVARLQGLTWTPTLIGPVTFLVTYPLSWLLAGWVPLAANSFTAVCAALSLVLLARSVALLPHDLSLEPPPRRRGFVPPQLLASRASWLPPLFAVLVCGLQLSFWQNAIAATGQMINLLMFAWIIRCLLEYNASGKDFWLLRAAFVYGLAVTNDWVMVAFLPLFLMVLIWVKRFFSLDQAQLEQWLRRRSSLNWRLGWQLPLCWLAGLSWFLLLPAHASLTSYARLDFWSTLAYTLHVFQISLAQIPRTLLITSILISVVPVFLIGLRYHHFLAGFNWMSRQLGTAFFELVHGFFFLLGLWLMFDPPLSPRQQAPGMDGLPLYFLQALSLGYFLGHFLLLTETRAETGGEWRRRSAPAEQRRQLLRRLNQIFKRALVVLIGLLAIGIPTALVCKNLPVIALKRSDHFGDYIAQLEQCLPANGGVVLGDDSIQLLYLQSALIRSGRSANYLLLNPQAWTEDPGYLNFLRQHNPGFKLVVSPLAQPGDSTNDLTLVTLLHGLSATRAICCFHPEPLLEPVSEDFYFEPHGLLYQVKPYPANAAFAGTNSPKLLHANETFWRTFEQQPFPDLVRQANPPVPTPVQGMFNRFLNTLRFRPELDRESQIVAGYYAGALNDWGVELQRAGKLPSAGHCFAAALQLDPFCAPARINQTFHADYQANRAETIARPLETANRMNEYRDWQHVVRAGAVDDPNFCFMLGCILEDHHLYRPAIAQFERVKALSPTRWETYLSLTRMFVQCNDNADGLNAANELLSLSPTNQAGLFLKARACLNLSDFNGALPVLNQLLALNPTNQMALLARGDACANLGRYESARRDYHAVLQTATNYYPAYAVLAKIAERETNRPAAISNYELFLKYAPTNQPEAPAVQARLKALER